jgi:hypothetical protein
VRLRHRLKSLSACGAQRQSRRERGNPRIT